MIIKIPLYATLAKIILKFNPFKNILVMCLGYNEDYKCYTELVWEDDKCLEFYDRETYSKFALWICFNR
jgi:hypothetical protein